MQIPGVEVTVHGPDTLLVGQETMFEVVAKNQGATDLNGLLLRLSVPASVTLGQIIATDGGAETEVDDNEKGIVWELPSLPKNSHKSLRMMLTTENPEHFAMSVEWTAIPQSQQYAIQVQQPRLELAIEGASEAVYGVPQTYRVRIQNPGNAVAKNVELLLEASSFGSNTSNIGDILPGDDKTVEVEFLFQKGGVIPIVAKAVSSSSNVQAAAEVDVQVNQSTLTATIEGPETFYQGSSAEFVLTLQNTGLTSALETRCTLVLPEGTQRVQLPSGATLEGNSLVWNAGEVAANQTLQIPLSLAFEKTGTNDLRLEATTISGSKAEAKHSLEVDAIIDLQLIVHDPAAPAPVGKDVYYDLEILNRGRKRASSVNVLVQFSEGIEPIRTEGHEARLIPGQVIFNNIPQIEPGQSIKLRVIAEASQAGVHRFRVEVKSDNGEADLLQEASTRYLNSTNPRR